MDARAAAEANTLIRLQRRRQPRARYARLWGKNSRTRRGRQPAKSSSVTRASLVSPTPPPTSRFVPTARADGFPAAEGSARRVSALAVPLGVGCLPQERHRYLRASRAKLASTATRRRLLAASTVTRASSSRTRLAKSAAAPQPVRLGATARLPAARLRLPVTTALWATIAAPRASLALANATHVDWAGTRTLLPQRVSMHALRVPPVILATSAARLR